MKRVSFFSWFILGAVALPFQQIEANTGPSPQQDPLLKINYSAAFKQSKIHERFKHLMIASGCAENVFSEWNEQSAKEDPSLNPSMQKAFDRACLKQLRSARRWAITEPARESLTMLALLTSAAIATNHNLSQESMGGSFSVFAAIFNGVFLLRDVINSGYNLAFQPQSALTRLEERFAQNQCFIPQALWAALIEKFMLARQNPFEQRKCMDFIEFTLGLTTYKPKQPLPLQAISAPEIIAELHRRIDQFFNDYHDTSDGECCRTLKVNIAKFVFDLINHTQTSRYIHLCGPGGIGKTYFVHTLCSWIEELLPGAVQYDNLVITSAEELEGSSQRPGAMLRVLRNQLLANKRGSVIFMDEATWLNHDGMISSAKRVFNGDQSTVSTSYFGNGIEGAGISLKMPPMLIFVASNDEIKEPALKSRFDTIRYPLPKEDALATHALNAIKRSLVLDQTTLPTSDNISLWIANNGIDNFRHVEANIEQFVLSQK